MELAGRCSSVDLYDARRHLSSPAAWSFILSLRKKVSGSVAPRMCERILLTGRAYFMRVPSACQYILLTLSVGLCCEHSLVTMWGLSRLSSIPSPRQNHELRMPHPVSVGT